MPRLAFGVVLLAVAAFAIAPPHVSYEELAKYPIVVEARWNGEAITDHSEVDGNVRKTWELRTEIVVERVVRGDIKPGTHTVLLGWPIAWEKDGGPVRGYSSTQVVGPACEVKDCNLWFLRRGRSWDKADPGPYLMLETCQGVQPLVLEPLFSALNKKDSHAAVDALLQVNVDPRIALAGLAVQPKPEFRKKYAKSVTRMLDHRDASVRARATAVFSEMVGKQAVPRLRGLLDDPDANVRGHAVLELARWRDEASLGAIARTAPGIEKVGLICIVIEQLGEWGHEGTVPALIAFLQEDEAGSPVGTIPALKARDALEQGMRLCWLPPAKY